MNRYLLVILIGLLALASCKKPDSSKGLDTVLPDDGVLVLNEGNYSFGNASVYLYDPAGDSVTPDLYASVNGLPLGDVGQSMIQVGDTLYVVVNNSGKIAMVSMLDFKSLGSITGFTSPRYMLPLGDGRAYVSDLYADAVSIFNLATGTITGSIPISGWTEKMLLSNGKVFICNYDSSRIEAVNPTTNNVTATIPVQGGAAHMVEDADGKLWVLAEKLLDGTVGSLTRIDPSNNSVLNSWNFGSNDGPLELRISADGQTVYYLTTDLYAMDSNAGSLPVVPLISAGSKNLYGFNLNKTGDQLYLIDAIDYNQKGTIYRYDLSGNELGSFKAGVIPGDLLFY